jgi:Flp pilus assembly protein TadG
MFRFGRTAHPNWGPAGNFSINDGGNVVVAFALVIPVLVGCLGVAIDYGRALTLKDKLHEAADSAALAATVAAGDGATNAEAAAVGEAQYAANSKLLAGGATSQPSISVDNTNGVVTSRVKFYGNIPTTFARIWRHDSIAVNGTSVAQASIKTITTKYAGSGDIWGDPHLDGADGYKVGFMCPNPYWYNMLSDGGIQVNIHCYHNIGGPYPNTDIITKVEMMLGNHTVAVAVPDPDANMNWSTSQLWHGEVTIDGVAYTPASSEKVANWTDQNGGTDTVWDHIDDGGNPANYGNDHVAVQTPQYTIEFFFNPMGEVVFSATNAGTCGAPGGLWGETLAGANDTTKSTTNPNDVSAAAFEEDTATSKAPEFARTPCAATIASKVRLIK